MLVPRVLPLTLGATNPIGYYHLLVVLEAARGEAGAACDGTASVGAVCCCLGASGCFAAPKGRLKADSDNGLSVTSYLHAVENEHAARWSTSVQLRNRQWGRRVLLNEAQACTSRTDTEAEVCSSVQWSMQHCETQCREKHKREDPCRDWEGLFDDNSTDLWKRQKLFSGKLGLQKLRVSTGKGYDE